MCWYCEHGLPPRVKAIFDKLEEDHFDYEYRFGHIVFSDFNLDNGSIEWCLKNIEKWRQGDPEQIELAEEWELNDILADEAALKALLEIPESERNPAPIDSY